MLHRHLTHQQYTLAAIIARGKRQDWAELRKAALADRAVLEKNPARLSGPRGRPLRPALSLLESLCRTIPCLKEAEMVKQFKIIVEKHPDGYVAYPLGLKGVVVGEVDTYEEALADVKSAIEFHIETFGPETENAVKL